MLSDLTSEQRDLADYMSDLSEEAYYAVWMEGLEYSLWDAMNGKLSEYGRLAITEDHRRKLHELSQRIQGWIVFDDQREEVCLPLELWERSLAGQRKKQE